MLIELWIMVYDVCAFLLPCYKLHIWQVFIYLQNLW